MINAKSGEDGALNALQPPNNPGNAPAQSRYEAWGLSQTRISISITKHFAP